MSTNSTLLCVHRNPAELSLLQESGYEMVTATNGHEALRLFMSRPVDAIVLEYYLGLLDGAVIADEIKRVRPTIPIVMLADHLELPDGALKSVDAVVTKSDGAHFLLATVHFMLNVRPAQVAGAGAGAKIKPQTTRHFRATLVTDGSQSISSKSPAEEKNTPFSPKVWRNIRNGTVQF
jgi:two-component system nitrogen regulation response regulator NtrX